jgi:thioredoxin 1
MNLVEISSEQQLEMILQSPMPVLIDFWAEWCTPCKNMEPVLARVAEARDLTIVKVNIDQHSELAKQYRIRSIPHFMLFKNGQPIGNPISGAYPFQDFITRIDKELAKT